MTRRRRWWALAWRILAACSGAPIDAPAQQPVRPAEAHRTAWLGNRLRESSGLARSTAWPGILWTHNDSGNEPVVFATDTTGADLGRFTLLGAENRDWEDLALGPCPAGTCLYVAETGDNGEDNRTAAIYRRHGTAIPPGPDSCGGWSGCCFDIPDQPRDVEAIFVAPDSSVHLISKGIRSGIVHYRLPASAWRGPSPAVRGAAFHARDRGNGPPPGDGRRPLPGWDHRGGPDLP